MRRSEALAERAPVDVEMLHCAQHDIRPMSPFNKAYWVCHKEERPERIRASRKTEVPPEEPNYGFGLVGVVVGVVVGAGFAAGGFCCAGATAFIG